MADPLAVKVKDCSHPGHEEGHSVFLAPTLTLDGGIAAEQDLVAADGDSQKLIRLWLRTFVTHGAVGWDFCDGEGNDIPFDLDTILADWSLARPVADAASDLYSHSVVAPFQNRPAGRSLNGRTGNTTSRRQRRTR